MMVAGQLPDNNFCKTDSGEVEHSTHLTRVHSMLVATDFSTASEAPLLHAIEIARRCGAKLHLVHIVSPLELLMRTAAGSRSARAQVEWEIQELLSRPALKSAASDLEIRPLVAIGQVGEGVCGIAQRLKVDLVVIGTHSRRGIGRMLLGSTAEQVFRQCSRPVLIIGPSVPRGWDISSKPILYSTDFSTPSLSALPQAISLANELDRQLVMLHVISGQPRPADLWIGALDAIRNRETLEGVVLDGLARLLQDRTGLRYEPGAMVVTDEPVHGILRAAHEIDSELIVLGTASQRFADPLTHLSGSTAYRITCCATCPVLILRGDPAANCEREALRPPSQDGLESEDT